MHAACRSCSADDVAKAREEAINGEPSFASSNHTTRLCCLINSGQLLKLTMWIWSHIFAWKHGTEIMDRKTFILVEKDTQHTHILVESFINVIHIIHIRGLRDQLPCQWENSLLMLSGNFINIKLYASKIADMTKLLWAERRENMIKLLWAERRESFKEFHPHDTQRPPSS
jgi:hypothetical protein